MAFKLIFEKRNTIFQCNLTFKSKTFTLHRIAEKIIVAIISIN